MSTPHKRTLSEAENGAARAALKEFQSAINTLYGQNAPALLVYGSYERGQQGPESDIDLLLLYSQEIHLGEEIRRVNFILADLNLRYQVLISVLPASQNEYQESSTPFWKNIRRESIPIEAI